MAQNFDEALALFTPDSIAITDGGAKERAARRTLIGGDEIVQVLRAQYEKAQSEQGWSTRVSMVNGKPAFLRYHYGLLDSVTTLAPCRSGKIAWLYIMRNPDKLGAAIHSRDH